MSTTRSHHSGGSGGDATGAEHSRRMGADGADPLDKARRLVTKLKMAKLQNMFLAWKESAEFEHTVEAIEQLVDPVAVGGVRSRLGGVA